jgi:hypothetical protein
MGSRPLLLTPEVAELSRISVFGCWGCWGCCGALGTADVGGTDLSELSVLPGVFGAGEDVLDAGTEEVDPGTSF